MKWQTLRVRAPTASLFTVAVLAACGDSGGGPPTSSGPLAWGAVTTLSMNAPLTTAPKVAVDASGVATACWSQAQLPGAAPPDVPFIGYSRSRASATWSPAQPSPTLAAGTNTGVLMLTATAAATGTFCAFRMRTNTDSISMLVLQGADSSFVDGVFGAHGSLSQIAFAGNPAGALATAWVESSVATPRVMFSMRLPFTGWSNTQELQTPGVAADQAAVAVDASNRVMVAWREGSTILARTVTLTGAAPALSPTQRVDAQSAPADQRQPRLAALSNGTFVALWEERAPGAANYVLRANSFGAAGWSAQPVNVDSNNEQADQAQVHASPNGGAIAVWRRGGGVWASRLLLGEWAKPVELTGTLPGAADQLDSAVDGQGHAVAVWIQRGATDDLHYSRFDAAMSAASTPVALDSAASAPSIALNASGVAAVAWLRKPNAQEQPTVMVRIAR